MLRHLDLHGIRAVAYTSNGVLDINGPGKRDRTPGSKKLLCPFSPSTRWACCWPCCLPSPSPSISHRRGVLLLFLAYGFALLEFQKNTSDFRFVVILVCGTALGISLDPRMIIGRG